MGLLSFMKYMVQSKKAEKLKPEKPKPYVSPCADLPKAPEYTHIRITTFFIGMDGSLKELPNDTTLQDGSCLISVDGHYYHQHVGCRYKGDSSLKMVTIEEAEKLGYMPCMVCADTMAASLSFEDNADEEDPED